MTAARKGASRRADVPKDVLAALNAGALESKTLAEGLAIDLPTLLAAAAPELPAHALAAVRSATGYLKKMHAAAHALHEAFGAEAIARFGGHASDTVRGWAAFCCGRTEGALAAVLARVRPLADDPHFGVREWAWMGVRPRLLEAPAATVAALVPWTAEGSPNLRRFASEVTRPRGVWCAHCPAFKADPSLGLPLLEPLRADPEKYVRDSVANWLNDAGKDQPEWLKALAARWRKESPSPHTAAILKRALRNL